MRSASFKKLDKTRLSDQIVDEICRMIANKELKQGDQLPPERELSEMLGVSRLPLREALKALEATSVIDTRLGDGYYVRGLDIVHLVKDFNMDTGVNYELFQEMKEARFILEAGAIKLACQRRTEKNIEEMASAIKQMEEALKKKEVHLVITTSMEFHSSMIKAAHNSFLNKMMACLYNTIVAGRINTYTQQPQRYDRSPQEHRALLQKIIDQDVESATRLLDEHLHDVF